MSLLQLKHINTGYEKRQVLFDVNLQVEQGETVLLVGANGSGKSTLLKAIFRLIPLWEASVKNTSQISFNNEEITTSPTYSLIQMGLMYVPQKNEHFEHMTVRENLNMSILHSKQKAKSNHVSNLLERSQALTNVANRRVINLSGGERKLVSMATLMLNKPLLALYDEPLAGVSSANVRILVENILDLKRAGITLIIVEHRVAELIDIADRIIGLKMGRLTDQRLNTLSEIKQLML